MHRINHFFATLRQNFRSPFSKCNYQRIGLCDDVAGRPPRLLPYQSQFVIIYKHRVGARHAITKLLRDGLIDPQEADLHLTSREMGGGSLRAVPPAAAPQQDAG